MSKVELGIILYQLLFLGSLVSCFSVRVLVNVHWVSLRLFFIFHTLQFCIRNAGLVVEALLIEIKEKWK